MPLNIKNEDAHRLARKLASLTNSSITEAVIAALQDAVEKVQFRARYSEQRLVSSLDEIAELCSELEILDTRTAEEILGYNERGVPE
jgi:antitoxin VapB